MNRIFNVIIKTNSRLQSLNGVCPCNVPILGPTNSIPDVNLIPKRFLYAKTAIGIDGYLVQRERTSQQLANVSDKFREKMRDYTQPNTTSMIFTEDLKNMVHMAETTDIELVKLMMKKFNSQNEELRFGSFVFGPVVMRMFHHLNSPDEALECFLDPGLKGFFNQAASFIVLMDLLYENGKYEDMLRTYDVIRENQVGGQMGSPPRHVVVLTLAACYRMRTEAAVERALNVWRECTVGGASPLRRSATFLAGLCVVQNRPQVALEIVSSCNNQNYTTIRNIKVLALCQLGRRDDALVILRSVFGQDDYAGGKHTFNNDVIAHVDESFKAETNTDTKMDYEKIRNQLVSQNLIIDTTLEEQLCREITTPAFVKQNMQQRKMNQFNNRQYNQDGTEQYRDRRQSSNNYPKQSRFTRPGLSELH